MNMLNVCLSEDGKVLLVTNHSLSTVTEVGDFDPRIHVSCIKKIYMRDWRKELSKN